MARTYIVEQYSPAEQKILNVFFTNLDRPVFGMKNMPQQVAGALPARYSRASVPLRRLFLDEFVNRQDVAVPALAEMRLVQTGQKWEKIDAELREQLEAAALTDWKADKALGFEAIAWLVPEVDRSARLFSGKHTATFIKRVFVGYGDDSVAQMSVAHLACEQASELNLMEGPLRSRISIGAIAKSTRYEKYMDQQEGQFRYYHDPDILAGPHATAYVEGMDFLFNTYAEAFEVAEAYFERAFTREDLDDESVAKGGQPLTDNEYRNTIRTKALDSIRGLLPFGTVSNAGLVASAQTWEGIVYRMLAHPLPEAQRYGQMILEELRHPDMIPTFLARVDEPGKGDVWVDYLKERRAGPQPLVDRFTAGHSQAQGQEQLVRLVSADPNGEAEVAARILYERNQHNLTLQECREIAETLSGDELDELFDKWTANRTNRRHKLGREAESVFYEIEVDMDISNARDLWRQRILTPLRSRYTPHLGYFLPPVVEDMGLGDKFREAMRRSAELYEVLQPDHPWACQYALAMAHRVRFSLKFNLRQADFMLSLRTIPQGHPVYRAACQLMHELICEVHPHLGRLMKFVDHKDYTLARLEEEKRNTAKRRALGIEEE